MEKQETFKFKKIADMSGQEMYCIARLRIDTFVTEQKITEPELDDQDLTAIQVFLLNEEQNRALAVCRILSVGSWPCSSCCSNTWATSWYKNDATGAPISARPWC